MCYFEESFSKLQKSFSIYWAAYGGWHEFFRSPYVHISALITVFVLLNAETLSDWRSIALSAIPSMLGFTLGGYALLIGFSDKEFVKKLILQYDEEGGAEQGQVRPTPYMQINGAFAHFIIVQSMTVVFAYVSKISNLNIQFLDALGNFLLLYTFTLVVAATFAVLTFADWYDTFGNRQG